MLMDETCEPQGQEQTKKSDESVVYIGNDPVMQSALDVLSIIGEYKKSLHQIKRNSIPNAVAVANIITEKNAKWKF